MPWSVFDQLSEGSTLKLSILDCRRASVMKFKKNPPVNFNVEIKKKDQPPSVALSVTSMKLSDFELIRDLAWQHLVLGEMEFTFQGQLKSIQAKPDFDASIKKIICPNLETLLAIEWPKDRLLAWTRSTIQYETKAYECSQNVYEKLKERISTEVYREVKRVFRFSKDEARVYVNAHGPSYDQAAQIWKEIHGGEKRERVSELEATRRFINKNPNAMTAPASLSVPLQEILNSLQSPDTPKHPTEVLIRFTRYWQSNKAAFNRHYDLYRDGMLVLEAIVNTGPSSDFGENAPESEISDLCHMLLACLEYISNGDVVLAYAPDNDQIFWSSFEKELGEKLREKLADVLPGKTDFVCLWSRRKHMAMHYALRFSACFERHKANRTFCEEIIRIFSNSTLPKLDVALQYRDSVARRMIDLGHYQFASQLVDLSYAGKIPTRFEVLNTYQSAIASIKSSGTISESILDEIFAQCYREFLFGIGSEWEKCCFSIITEKYDGVLADQRNETRLSNGQRPDFIIGGTKSDERGITFGETFIDAKKSLLAVSSDIEDYGPFCNELIFYVLERNVDFKFSNSPKVSVRFAEDLAKEVKDADTRKDIAELLNKVASSKVLIKERVEALCSKLHAEEKMAG